MTRSWLLALVIVPAFASAQGAPTTPASGSPLRKQLLDVARAHVERDLGGIKVKFVVDRLTVLGDWAFLIARPQTADGKRIDYRRTRYAEAVSEGLFDDGLSMLLKRDGKAWKVKAYSLGAKDVPWVGWPEEYGAPKSLFPGAEGG